MNNNFKTRERKNRTKGETLKVLILSSLFLLSFLFLINFSSASSFAYTYLDKPVTTSGSTNNTYLNNTYTNVTYDGSWINSTVDSKILVNNNSVVNWINNIFVKFSDTVNQVGNWSADKVNYALTATLNNGSYLNYAWNSTNTSYLEIKNWNATNTSYLLVSQWNATNTSYISYSNHYNDSVWGWVTNGSIWSWVMNASVMHPSDWNATNTSYVPFTGAASNVNLGIYNYTSTGAVICGGAIAGDQFKVSTVGEGVGVSFRIGDAAGQVGSIYINEKGATGGFIQQYSKTTTTAIIDSNTITLDRGSGNGAAGFGLAQVFRLENGAGARKDAGRIKFVWNNATSGGEDTDIIFQAEVRGALTDVVNITQRNVLINQTLQLLANKSAVTCNIVNAGMIYYDNTTFKHYGCNTTTWNALY